MISDFISLDFKWVELFEWTENTAYFSPKNVWGCSEDAVMIFLSRKWSKQFCSTCHPLEQITGPHVWTTKLFPCISALSECMHNASVLSLPLINWSGNYIDAAVRPDASELSFWKSRWQIKPDKHGACNGEFNKSCIWSHTWHSEMSSENCNMRVYLNHLLIVLWSACEAHNR